MGVKYKDQKVKMQIFLDTIHKSLIQYGNKKNATFLRELLHYT